MCSDMQAIIRNFFVAASQHAPGYSICMVCCNYSLITLAEILKQDDATRNVSGVFEDIVIALGQVWTR